MATLRPDEIKHIAENYRFKTVPDLATDLKRGAATLYEYFKEANLKPLKGKYSPPRSHPFRKANRSLEAVFINRKIENRKHNPK